MTNTILGKERGEAHYFSTGGVQVECSTAADQGPRTSASSTILQPAWAQCIKRKFEIFAACHKTCHSHVQNKLLCALSQSTCESADRQLALLRSQ